MAYIGRENVVGRFVKLSLSGSFNGSTTSFTLQDSQGTAIVPQNEENCIISYNGSYFRILFDVGDCIFDCGSKRSIC